MFPSKKQKVQKQYYSSEGSHITQTQNSKYGYKNISNNLEIFTQISIIKIILYANRVNFTRNKRTFRHILKKARHY